jgi:hypothetical protein
MYTINLRVSESDAGLSNAKRDLLIQVISLEEQGTAYPSGAPEFTPSSESKKNRQYNGQKKRYKRTNNDL